VRLQESDGTLVAPGSFLPIAERFGLVPDIDCWVVRRAIALLAAQQHAGADVSLAVNVSARSVDDPRLVAVLERELASTGADPHRLILEITETAAIDNLEHAQRFARRVRGPGCELALDEFGAGFASFVSLKHLDFDLVKIDGGFIVDLAGDRTNQLVVRAVAEARELGKRTVAEFVDDERTLAMLASTGSTTSRATTWAARCRSRRSAWSSTPSPARPRRHRRDTVRAVSPQDTLRRTPLFDRHEAAGAKLVPFAGWEMPVQYPAGIRAEHLAVRSAAGVFDVSHMGQIETRGPGARDLLQRLLSNDVDRLAVGGAQYALLCHEGGGVLDDLFTYRLGPDHYLTVTNAANHDKDHAWFRHHADGTQGAEVVDAHERYAMLAVQGPGAREIVQAMADAPLPARMHTAQLVLDGHSVLVCGTGYTGEDGVELLADPDDAVALWDEIVDRGAAPVGLAARDTLRLEVCFHLYGNDLMEERGPIEAGLGWACKEATGFIGAEAVRAVREEGPVEHLAAFRLTGPGIARPGNPIAGGGEVTSGTLSPSLGVGIGMAYVPPQAATVGTELQIDVRGRARGAVVAQKPLYRREEQEPHG